MDIDLINGLKNKDEKSILCFVQTYQDIVFNQCYNLLKNYHEAEEATQDIFIKAINKIHTFEKRSKLKTWLYRIAYTTCLDVLKKRKNFIYAKETVEIYETADFEHVSKMINTIDSEAQKIIIDKTIDKLNVLDAAIVRYYYLDELSTKEIAKITDFSQSNIKIRLYRARKELNQLLLIALPSEVVENYQNGR